VSEEYVQEGALAGGCSGFAVHIQGIFAVLKMGLSGQKGGSTGKVHRRCGKERPTASFPKYLKGGDTHPASIPPGRPAAGLFPRCSRAQKPRQTAGYPLSLSSAPGKSARIGRTAPTRSAGMRSARLPTGCQFVSKMTEASGAFAAGFCGLLAILSTPGLSR
jgi:hypothetical protein